MHPGSGVLDKMAGVWWGWTGYELSQWWGLSGGGWMMMASTVCCNSSICVQDLLNTLNGGIAGILRVVAAPFMIGSGKKVSNFLY